MKSNRLILSIMAASVFAFNLTACSSTSTNTAATNANSANSSTAAIANSNSTANAAANADSNTTAAANTAANAATNVDTAQDSLAAPSDTFKTFYAALASRDEAKFRKALSRDSLASMDKILSDPQIKNEGYTKAVDFVVDGLQLARVSTDLPEITSEKVTGNTALLEFRVAKTGQTDKVYFVKEGSDWKLDQSPEQKKEAQAAIEKSKQLLKKKAAQAAAPENQPAR